MCLYKKYLIPGVQCGDVITYDREIDDISDLQVVSRPLIGNKSTKVMAFIAHPVERSSGGETLSEFDT